MNVAFDSKPDAKAQGRIDPVTVEVIRNGLIAVTEEMKTNLMRTAYNMIIYEALDFTVGLFDARGETVSIGLGLPMFIRGMSDTVKAKIRHFGLDDIEPGDILLTNDAYIDRQPSQPHDLLGADLSRWQGRRLFELHGALDRCRRHAVGRYHRHLSEGLQMPIVKAYRKGEPNQDVMRYHPHECAGAGARHGRLARPDRRREDRRKAFPRNDPEIRHRCCARLASTPSWSRARRSRASGCGRFPTASTKPSPTWTTTASALGKRIPIRVKVEVAGDRMTVDLSEVSRQVAGFYNSGETAGRSCVPGGVQMPDVGARSADQ